MASRRSSAKKSIEMTTQRTNNDDNEALIMPKTGNQPEEIRNESKLFKQPRNERTGFFSWGRLTCGKVVAFIVKLLFCCGFFKLIKRFLCRLFKCLYEALRDKEDMPDHSQYQDSLIDE